MGNVNYLTEVFLGALVITNIILMIKDIKNFRINISKAQRQASAKSPPKYHPVNRNHKISPEASIIQPACGVTSSVNGWIPAITHTVQIYRTYWPEAIPALSCQPY
jgi:hypothetical protein